MNNILFMLLIYKFIQIIRLINYYITKDEYIKT